VIQPKTSSRFRTAERVSVMVEFRTALPENQTTDRDPLIKILQNQISHEVEQGA